FFIFNKESEEPVCLMCHKTVSVLQTSNFERHYLTVHGDLMNKDTTVMRRVETIGQDIRQVISEVSTAPCYSLGLDESLLSVICNFLESKGKEEKELDDPDWLINLACLTDITSSLNVLNLQLQGKQKMSSDMLRVITAFQSKIRTEFQLRFEDIMGLKEVFCFFENPFPMSVSSVSPALTDPGADQAAVENEIVEIQSDYILKEELIN
ncbi:GT2D2 protein, partial [Polyodon spathula]|nr:GT2D2 protein [Polyodon spathula]